MVAFSGQTSGSPTVSDSQSNAYFSAPSNAGSVSCFWASASSSAALTVTISSVTATTWFHAVVVEIANAGIIDVDRGATTNGVNPTITLASPGTQSPNELMVTPVFWGAPGTALTFTQTSSTLVAQAGNSTNGYLVLLSNNVPTQGTLQNATVNVSNTTPTYAITGLTFYGSASPWMRGTGSDYPSAIGFKGASGGPPGGGSDGIALSLGLRRIRL